MHQPEFKHHAIDGTRRMYPPPMQASQTGSAMRGSALNDFSQHRSFKVLCSTSPNARETASTPCRRSLWIQPPEACQSILTQTAHRHLNQPWPSHRGDGNGWLHARKGVSMVTGHTPLFVRAHRAETARGQRTCPQQHQPGTTPAVARSTQHRMQTQDKHVQTSLLGTPSDDACRHVRGAALHLAYHMLPHHSSHQTCRRQRARARG
jgi:hypothetical protein